MPTMKRPSMTAKKGNEVIEPAHTIQEIEWSLVAIGLARLLARLPACLLACLLTCSCSFPIGFVCACPLLVAQTFADARCAAW
jgi:hypothetical protein